MVLVVFHHLARTGVKAHERGEELRGAPRSSGTLQVGVLTTVMQTLVDARRDDRAPLGAPSPATRARSRELLGCDEREQDLIHTAALLHDIGKFILPDSVLFANRKLTDDEWELIKLHPEQGAKLVERIDGYGPVAEIVLHHHERYAGGGYPAGIAGEEIPLGARIIAAADTYDVMTSRDSYRRPVSSEAALAELRRVAGTQLDPRVAEAFERMILERGVAFSARRRDRLRVRAPARAPHPRRSARRRQSSAQRRASPHRFSSLRPCRTIRACTTAKPISAARAGRWSSTSPAPAGRSGARRRTPGSSSAGR